jgi:hypothetical protein
MKYLSAVLTAVALFGFAGAAAAQCASYSKQDQTAQNQTIILPEGTAGS